MHKMDLDKTFIEGQGKTFGSWEQIKQKKVISSQEVSSIMLCRH